MHRKALTLFTPQRSAARRGAGRALLLETNASATLFPRRNVERAMTIVDSVLLPCFDGFVRYGGPFFVLFGVTLVSAVAVFFFSTPFVPLAPTDPLRIGLSVFGVYLYANIVINWLLCVFTHPGRPPQINPPSPVDRACQRCGDVWKPPRAHHCHVCNSCVLAYDHHCPWMATCIGHLNYRYFFLTLLHLAAGCAFIVALLWAYFDAPAHLMLGKYHKLPYPVTFTLMLVVAAGPPVTVLLVWHVFLIHTGQSTVEFYRRKVRLWEWHRGERGALNPYDLGPQRNWVRVFGDSSFPLHWARPSLRKPPGDGLQWATSKSLVGDV